MNIIKDLPDLVRQGILNEETADRIRKYYQEKQPNVGNRLFLVFALIGAILVGLGLFLIIAHNWDDLSVGVKTVIAFLPLVAGLAAAGYSLVKQPESAGWREASAAFLFLSVGVCIALIGQIYHIPDETDVFLLKWMLMSLPIAYVMGSSMASLLYFVGITYFTFESGYDYRGTGWLAYAFWPMLLAGLPFYIFKARKTPLSNFVMFHHWIIPISIAVSLGSFGKSDEILLVPAYFSLFGLFYLIGSIPSLHQGKVIGNGYAVIGLLGQLVMLLVFSFDGAWGEVFDNDHRFMPLLDAPEWYAAVGLTLGAAVLLAWETVKGGLKSVDPIGPVFLVFAAMYLFGMHPVVSAVIINVLVLAISVITIIRGARLENLGTLNLGMLILSALIVCRFFDSDISFVIRGLLFVLLGGGFFAANYWMISKRNKQDGK